MTTTINPYLVFMDSIRSEFTRRLYKSLLGKFFASIPSLKGATIQEQCSVFVENARKDSNWPLQQILGFMRVQRQRVDNKEMVGCTARNYVFAIRLFCEENNILLTIPWKKLTRGLPRGRKWADDRTPTLEEIKKLVEYPDRRIKALICTMVSSGIRLGAWDYLKWGHISPVDAGVAKIRVYAGEEEEYWTFISPEAYKALQDWMDFRRAAGENVTRDSWVMRQLWDLRHGVRAGGTGGSATTPKKLAYDGIKSLIEGAIWTQGLRTKLAPGNRRHEFQMHHGFRKFFKTHAEQVMKPINVELLMGHSTGLSDSYYRPRENELLEDYLKAVPLLTINYREDRSSIVEAAAEAAESKLQERDKQIEGLIKKQEQFEQMIQSLIDSGRLQPSIPK